MKHIVCGLIAALLGILAVVGGFGIGIGGFAYGVWLIICMIKGTMVTSFANVLLTIVCWVASGPVGWLWAMFWGFIASIFGAIATDK